MFIVRIKNDIINFINILKWEEKMGILKNNIEKEIDNKPIYIYSLENENSKIEITNFGGIILSFITKDKDMIILKIIKQLQHILVQ